MTSPAPAAPTTPPGYRRTRRAARLLSWVTLAVLLGVSITLRFGDAWWPATVLMFGPRWPWVVPPACLAAALVPLKWAGRGPAVLSLGVALGPVMGGCVPWRQVMEGSPEGGFRVRVMTCNMHFGTGDSAGLDALIREERPDVVALQEWRDSATSAELSGAGWHVRREPGLFLASRFPIRGFARLGSVSSAPEGSGARYDLDADGGRLAVFSAHLASPREGLAGVARAGGRAGDAVEANSAVRGEQSARLGEAAADTAGPVLLVGDFNTPPESVLFRRAWAGYEDAFGAAGWGWGYTFTNRATRTRIDHILVGGGGHAAKCWVGPDVGSPHRPVFADVEWPATP